MNLSKYIDHTLLKPTATPDDIRQLCREAKEHRFYSVCVNGCYLPLAKEELKGSDVKVAVVAGFPLGAMSSGSKLYEIVNYLEDGADEIDMVMNIGWLKAGMFDEVEEEIGMIKTLIGDKVLKVIIETCYLTDAEKIKATQLVVNAGADFVKTSTGFGNGGATLDDVQLMAETAAGRIKIKASGGIRDQKTAEEYIKIGVDRIGTSSGITIVTGGKNGTKSSY